MTGEKSVETKEPPWWLAVLGGVMLLGVTAWVYQYLTAFEAQGGERRAPWLIALLYNYLGKWGVVGLCGLGGLGAVVHGVLLLRAKLSGGGAEARPRRKKKPRPRPGAGPGQPDVRL
ncbi:MAG TPA: hypothetical protein VGF55_15445 [Gemmataceae bacterium]|jgi:hypothetical protein